MVKNGDREAKRALGPGAQLPQADLAAAKKPSGTSLADGGNVVQSVVSKNSLKV